MKFCIPSFIAPVAVGLLVGACGANPSPSRLSDTAAARAEVQAASLSNVFYNNAQRPPRPSTRELTDVRALVADAAHDDQEIKLFKKLFASHAAGMAWAHRDTDGDGIFDFRVSHLDGKFFEGDVDLDEDGIRNVLDEDPFDPAIGGRDRNHDGHPDSGFTDVNSNKIPDHVDFAVVLSSRYRRAAEVLAQMVDICRIVASRRITSSATTL